MKKILSILWLVSGLAIMPVAHAADEAPADQKKEQKAGEDKKPAEDGKKKGEQKGDGGAEPECS